MDGLTDRQAFTLAKIEEHLGRHGYPPTIRELRGLLSVKSLNAVYGLLEALAVKGFIERDKGRSRGIRMLRSSSPSSVWVQGGAACNRCGWHWQAVVEEASGVPFVGGLECPACRNMTGRWTTPRAHFPKGE